MKNGSVHIENGKWMRDRIRGRGGGEMGWVAEGKARRYQQSRNGGIT